MRLSPSDGGSSGREEDEDSLYRMSQYSPDLYNPALETRDEEEEEERKEEEQKTEDTPFYSDKEDDF